MQTHLQGRDVIDFQEWTKDEIDTLLDDLYKSPPEVVQLAKDAIGAR